MNAVRESEIESHEATIFATAHVGESIVGSGLKELVRNGRDIVACGPKTFQYSTAPKVLVELESQPVPSAGKSMYRSRAISAP